MGHHVYQLIAHIFTLQVQRILTSQRTPGSPKRNTKVENEADKQMKTRAKTKAMMAMGQPSRDEMRHMAQHGANPFLIDKSDLAREAVSPTRHTNIISHGEKIQRFSVKSRNITMEEIMTEWILRLLLH